MVFDIACPLFALPRGRKSTQMQHSYLSFTPRSLLTLGRTHKFHEYAIRRRRNRVLPVTLSLRTRPLRCVVSAHRAGLPGTCLEEALAHTNGVAGHDPEGRRHRHGDLFTCTRALDEHHAGVGAVGEPARARNGVDDGQTIRIGIFA